MAFSQENDGGVVMESLVSQDSSTPFHSAQNDEREKLRLRDEQATTQGRPIRRTK